MINLDRSTIPGDESREFDVGAVGACSRGTIMRMQGRTARGRPELTWLAHLANVPLEASLDGVFVDEEPVPVRVGPEVVTYLQRHILSETVG